MDNCNDTITNPALETTSCLLAEENVMETSLSEPLVEPAPIATATISTNNTIMDSPSLTFNRGSLVNYDDTSDECSTGDDDEDTKVTPSELKYRQTSVSQSDSSDTSDSDDGDCKLVEVVKQVSGIPRVKGELTIDDLPPIEDLTITVKEEETLILGKIQSIVDQLVVIQSFSGMPAVDIDSVLFLEQGKRPLGKVFDVIGPVKEPLYCVRFNSYTHIKEKQILVGDAVYFAPKTVHTSFIFLPDLLQHKGSDASWENDIEPPTKYLDYSDDEAERSARKVTKKPAENGEPDKSQHQQSAAVPKNLTNRERRRQTYRKNFNFPVYSNDFQRPNGPHNQEMFNAHSCNQVPSYSNPVVNRMPPPIHQQFPNTGQQAPDQFPPIYNNQSLSNNYNSFVHPATNTWLAANATPSHNLDMSRPPPPLPPNPSCGGGQDPPPPGTF